MSSQMEQDKAVVVARWSDCVTYRNKIIGVWFVYRESNPDVNVGQGVTESGSWADARSRVEAESASEDSLSLAQPSPLKYVPSVATDSTGPFPAEPAVSAEGAKMVEIHRPTNAELWQRLKDAVQSQAKHGCNQDDWFHEAQWCIAALSTQPTVQPEEYGEKCGCGHKIVLHNTEDGSCSVCPCAEIRAAKPAEGERGIEAELLAQLEYIAQQYRMLIGSTPTKTPADSIAEMRHVDNVLLAIEAHRRGKGEK